MAIHWKNVCEALTQNKAENMQTTSRMKFSKLKKRTATQWQRLENESEAYYQAYGARYCYEQTIGGQHEIK